MAEMIEVWEPGDFVYTMSKDGAVKEWIVAHDGSVVPRLK